MSVPANFIRITVTLQIVLLSFSCYAQRLELMLPVGHTTTIKWAEFSPDSRFVITIAQDDPIARVWESATGKLFHTLEHEKTINSIHFSLDGKFILSTSMDQTVRLWSHSGEQIFKMTGHKGNVNDAQFSSDGKLAASVSDDNSVLLWNLITGELLKPLVGHSDDVTFCQFLPHSQLLITGSDDATSRVWDINDGRCLRVMLHGRPEKVRVGLEGMVLSNDGKKVITWNYKGPAKVWDTSSGTSLYSLEGKMWGFKHLEFSKDGTQILGVGGTLDKAARLFDSKDGTLIKTVRDKGFSYCTFSADDRFIVLTPESGNPVLIDKWTSGIIRSYNSDIDPNRWSSRAMTHFDRSGTRLLTIAGSRVMIFEANSGRLISSITGTTRFVNEMHTKRDLIVTSSGKYSWLWSKSDGQLLEILEGGAKCVEFNPIDDRVVTIDNSDVKIWQQSDGRKIAEIDDLKSERKAGWNFGNHILHNPDGKSFLTYSSFMNKGVHVYKSDGSARLFSIELGQWDKTAFYCRDGRFLVTTREYLNGGYKKYRLQVWNSQTGKLISSVMFKKGFRSSTISPNGELIASNLGDSVIITGAQTGIEVGKLKNTGRISDVRFNPESKLIVTASGDSTARVWDITGNMLAEFPHSSGVLSARFTPTGVEIMTEASDDTMRLWQMASNKLLYKFKKKAPIKRVDWENYLLYTHNKSELSVYDIRTGEYLLSWLAVDSADWIVKHPSGLFDASVGAMGKMYFMYGADHIEMSQLKKRYYEPGLWKKIMNHEKLREVVGFNSVELPPDIQLADIDQDGQLQIQVTNRAGGIGRTMVKINGKEIIADARPINFNPNSAALNLKIQIKGHPNLLMGTENTIDVQAWNGGEWIISRPASVIYTSPEFDTRGVVVEVNEGKKKETIIPTIYIVACGVSDYEGTKIDLKFAAKDAESASNALAIGAKRLFGTDRSFVYLLSSQTTIAPTKVNIVNTFKTIASKASSRDIIVVYLAGHGINTGGEASDFHYLTANAHSTDLEDFKDPAVLKNTTISSQELIDLIKSVPALKQVLMIDACASGKLVENMMGKRDIGSDQMSSQLRAFDRMKDVLGMHIITGCASDAVSYESPRYGQGILTYSLIEGIKGQALKDEKQIDVLKLFQYAEQRVPELVKDFGIQKPQPFSPNGSKSFVIGELTAEDKARIPLATVKPIYIRSLFIDRNSDEDGLDLSRAVDESLNEVYQRGSNNTFIYRDVTTYPDACRLSGTYVQKDGHLSLSLKMRCSAEVKQVQLSAPTKEELIKLVLEIIK